MTAKEAKERIEKLKELINRHRYLYHVFDRQEISDNVLDSLKKELFDLEGRFPGLVALDSPTQRVGGKPLKKFAKVVHSEPMLSLNDGFSKNDVFDWQSRLERILDRERFKAIDFYCEFKIDGLAVELNYQKGIFNQGSTRGNGLIGENITQNIRTIEAIPLKIRKGKESLADLAELIGDKAKEKMTVFLENLVVRGEVFISKKEFQAINELQAKNKFSLYANPRNIAAGSVRQLDPKITASRRLDSFAYEIVSDIFKTHQQKHQALKIMGFKTNPYNRYCRNLKEVFDFYDYARNIRDKLPYEIDGIVVLVNNDQILKSLGVAGKAPRGAIAYKFPLKQATTILEGVAFQVGRTGVITPVALLKPVSVGGVVVSRATLHNQGEIEKLGVKIKDTVIVGRAGDVIPDVLKVLPELRSGKEKEIKMPEKCPVCREPLFKSEKEAAWRCLNRFCPAKQRESLYHFASRAAFNIEGLGPKIIDQLASEGLLKDVSDFFTLKQNQLLPLAGFASKKAENIISAISKSKKVGLVEFIYGLGIRNVGRETAADLAEKFATFEGIKNVSKEDLLAIEGIGPVAAESIYLWLRNKSNLRLLERLISNGVIITAFNQKKGNKLKGKTFVFTGQLKAVSREKAGSMVKGIGGNVSGAVSLKTDFLVIGDDYGLKRQKAKEIGVKTINEKEFLKIVRS